MEVLSPTFNIVQYYNVNNRISIAHYDLYRLKSKKDLDNIGIFDYEDQFINLVEWPKLLNKKINKISIKLKYTKMRKVEKFISKISEDLKLNHEKLQVMHLFDHFTVLIKKEKIYIDFLHKKKNQIYTITLKLTKFS